MFHSRERYVVKVFLFLCRFYVFFLFFFCMFNCRAIKEVAVWSSDCTLNGNGNENVWSVGLVLDLVLFLLCRLVFMFHLLNK